MIFPHVGSDLHKTIEGVVEAALGGLRPGLRFAVDEVFAHEAEPHILRIRSTLHFNHKGSPYCCGEPGCHLGVRRWAAVTERVRLAAGVSEVHFEDVATVYHAGVTFARY